MRETSLGLPSLVFLALLCACDTTFDPPIDQYPDPFCCPSWVGTDSLIAFRNNGLRNDAHRGIWIRPRNRSAGWQVMRGDARALDYSPVTEAITFEQGMQIFAASFEGGVVDTVSITQLTYAGQNFFPTWSPDGTWIAYDQRYCQDSYDLADTTCGTFVVRPDNSASRFIARGVYPQWSPTGDEIVYARHGEVYAIDFPVGVERHLTALHESFEPAVSVAALSYSPDGTTILVELRTRPDPSIWSFPAAGGPLKRWFNGQAPSWSPSGRFIAFTELGNPDPGMDGTVWVFDRTTHRVTQITYP